ncbi:hypothetical protein [Rhodopirellula sp. MGV]|uniref:hypothetical protein n=1 Tax=Rhodopirellula sp. MGV TaxID=2023130 RepID=UPI000B977E13|nr:hypothetical protein [Rhodopirellula sp. MGV]OYP37630.1 hypothetical protein CGZ80_04780 [Rhodopirellula sp. MGV]PNY34948.1 hypothetical protein C2E31_20825 [Rhodopirellula baltica]
MSSIKISDLLPLSPDVTKPNAYQVFGLESGEQDLERVKSAIRNAYRNLRGTRDSAPPQSWKQALKLAEAARQVLEDPDKKRELDAKLLAAAAPKPPADVAVANPVADPLADLLPKSNPISSQSAPAPSGQPVPNQAAAVLGLPPLGAPPPGTPPLGTPPSAQASPSVPTPAPVASTTIPGLPTQPQVAVQAEPVVMPQSVGWAPPKATPGRRRKRKNTGMLMFGVLVLAMIGGIIYLMLRFLDDKPIQLARTTDGGYVVSQPNDSNAARDPRAKSDGVMAAAPSSGIASAVPRQPSKFTPPSDTPASQPMMGQQPMSDPSMTEPTMPEEAMPNLAMASSPPATEMASADQGEAIASLEQLIKDANWDKMKPEADRLLKQNLPGDQGKRVSTLYDIADLASYYRGGIVRGLQSLKTGNTFDVVEGFPVIVVQASASSLTVQYDRKNKQYTIDTLPPALVTVLASKTLNHELSDVKAALSLYRLIHPSTNDDYRKDAWVQLESVDGQLKDLDSANLIKVAKELLAK